MYGVIKLNFTERQFSIDYRLLEPVGSYIHKGERQHTGVDMYRNVDSYVTRKWLAYRVPADLSDLLCHTGRHRISSSLKLLHRMPDNIIAFKNCLLSTREMYLLVYVRECAVAVPI